jgi:hypothetical protein
MEKAHGIELDKVWDDMKSRDKATLVKNLAGVTAQLSKTRLPGYGSLYYRADMPDCEGVLVDDTFMVGPTVGRAWFDDQRGEIDVSRGPCK